MSQNKLEKEDLVKMEVDYQDVKCATQPTFELKHSLSQQQETYCQVKCEPTTLVLSQMKPSQHSEKMVKLSHCSAKVSHYVEPKQEDQPMKDESKPKLLTLDHLVKPQKFCMDDFTTCDLIGEGTYGKVFKCALSQRLVDLQVGTHDWTNTFKAMKSIKFENDKEGFPITALREIQILKLLKHENIVQLEEVDCQQSSVQNLLFVSPQQSTDQFSLQSQKVNLVFEYVPYDLFGIIALKPKYSVMQAGCLLKQILRGLAYLEEQRVLHRDIKSANILMTPSGVIKLCDFGLARFLHSKSNPLTPRVVTRWYRAPEILLDDPHYSYGADVWAVGCVFAEILTEGKNMFAGKNELDTLSLICQLQQSQDFQEEDLTEFKSYSKQTDLINILTSGGVSPGQKRSYAQNSVVEWLKDYSYIETEANSDILFSLCEQMLTFAKWKRPSASQLLQSSAFLRNLDISEHVGGLLPVALRSDMSLTANEFSHRKKPSQTKSNQ